MLHVGHRLPERLRPGARPAPVAGRRQRAPGDVPKRRAQGADATATAARRGRHAPAAGRDQAADRLRHVADEQRPRQLRRVHHEAVPVRRRGPGLPLFAVHRGVRVRVIYQQPGPVSGQTRVAGPGRPHRIRGRHTVHVLFRRPPARTGKSTTLCYYYPDDLAECVFH